MNGASVGVSAALESVDGPRITSKKVVLFVSSSDKDIKTTSFAPSLLLFPCLPKTEDFKNLSDQLGRVRNLGHGSKESHPRVYGKASLPAQGRESTFNDARSCIEGDYTYDEQAPDSDLGKTHTPGFRNTTAESRAFGVPTVREFGLVRCRCPDRQRDSHHITPPPQIRSDIPQVGRRSIADDQNYGDDANAQYLLYPQQVHFG